MRSAMAVVSTNIILFQFCARQRMVIKTKSVEFMPFFLSFFLFLNGGVWSVYAVLVTDFFIGVSSLNSFHPFPILWRLSIGDLWSSLLIFLQWVLQKGSNFPTHLNDSQPEKEYCNHHTPFSSINTSYDHAGFFGIWLRVMAWYDFRFQMP